MNGFRKSVTVIFIILIIAGTYFLFFYHFQLAKQESNIKKDEVEEDVYKINDNIYKFGNIKVDLERKKIEFPAFVSKNKEKVKFLIYLQGYKWLEEESVIVSKDNLSNLQKAIALLDWCLWDNLWYGKEISPDKEIRIWIRWHKQGEVRKVNAFNMVKNGESLEVENLIFFGSPYLDEIVLGGRYRDIECFRCPLLHFEKNIIFGDLPAVEYELDASVMPPVGTHVVITIYII